MPSSVSLKAKATPGSAPASLQQLALCTHFPSIRLQDGPGALSADITHIVVSTFNHPPNAILLHLDSGSSRRLLLLCLFDVSWFVCLFFSLEVSSLFLALNDDARLFYIFLVPGLELEGTVCVL